MSSSVQCAVSMGVGHHAKDRGGARIVSLASLSFKPDNMTLAANLACRCLPQQKLQPEIITRKLEGHDDMAAHSTTTM